MCAVSRLWSPGKVMLVWQCRSSAYNVKDGFVPVKSQEVIMLMLWRKVMQIARSTTGTAVLTFIKHLVLFIMEGVTLSCKTTFGRRELLLGCAVQMQSSGSQQSLWYCLGKLGSGQHWKLKSHVAACCACLHLSLCPQASLRGRKLSDNLSVPSHVR